MFDELDDPAPPVPGPGVRAAVASRGLRIRRNRRLVQAGSAASVVVLAASVAGLAGRPDATSRIEPVTTASATTVPSPSPSPSASPAGPEPTGGPSSPAPTPEPPRTTPSPAPSPSEGEEGPGFEGCRDAEGLPARGAAPTEDLHIELEVADPVERGADVPGTLVIVNNSTTDGWQFDLVAAGGTGILQTVARNAAGDLSGLHWTDAIWVQRVQLAPGDSWEAEVEVPTRTCDAMLPAGAYDLAVGVEWQDLRRWYGPSPTPGPTGTGEPLQVPPVSRTPAPSPTPVEAEPVQGWTPWGTEPVAVTFF